MFVYSFKASKLKVILSVVICAAIAAAVIMLMPQTEHSVSVNGGRYDRKISFDGIKSTEDLVKFAENLGYSVDAKPVEEAEVKIPSKFDAVLEKYNDIQKSQGFNMGKYKNKTAVRYTFRVTALPDGEEMPKEDVLLTLIVLKDKIIGGDLYFTGENGQVKPFL